MKDTPRFEPEDVDSWRAWLRDRHATETAVWLVYRKASAGSPNLSWSEAVDEALCYGWIDSKAQRIDDQRYEQYFTRRKPTSVWSRINKDKIERLAAEGRLHQTGLAAVARAQENGSWSILDEAEARRPPADLLVAFEGAPGTAERFAALPPSQQRNALQWILTAKRPETRARRVSLTVSQLADDGDEAEEAS